MNKAVISKYPRAFLKNCLIYLLGVIGGFGVLILILVSLPMYLYRWIICKVAAPLWGGGSLGKAVTVNGTFFATELKGDSSQITSKCVVISSCVFEGELTLESLRDRIDRGWITARKTPIGAGGDAEGEGELLYPEFQQYIQEWMGFMFWKQDETFSLDNHLVHHKCEEGWNEGECETFVCSTVEELLNKPFPKGRSPWEMHLVSGYRNEALLPGGGEMSVMMFRFHHCLGDGFSIIQAILEGLFGIPLKECGIASAAPSPSKTETSGKSCLKKLLSFPTVLSSVLWDMGHALSLTLIPTRTRWWIPDGEKTRLVYGRSGLIPISKIKCVKNKFGVGFTSVLLSSIGAGAAHSFRERKSANGVRKLPCGLVVPLRDHPSYKMRNHSTGAILEIPVEQGLSPLERLRKSERCFQRGRHSNYPAISAVMLKLTASQITPISRLLTENRTFPTYLTNFPGVGVKVKGADRSLITKDLAGSLGLGVTGVGFHAISYCDHIRLAATADQAALSRHELEELIEVVCGEIDRLYELAIKENNDIVIKITPASDTI